MHLDNLELYVRGELSLTEMEGVERHVRTCDLCAQALVFEAQLEIALTELVENPGKSLQYRWYIRQPLRSSAGLLPICTLLVLVLYFSRTSSQKSEPLTHRTGQSEIVKSAKPTIQFPGGSECLRYAPDHAYYRMTVPQMNIPRYEGQINLADNYAGPQEL